MTAEMKINIPEASLKNIQRIVDSDSDNFLHLVSAANLNKRTDFRGMSLSGMKLDGLELVGFNFSDADFRECSLKGTVFIECELKGAAFSFPSNIRNKWRQNPDFFVGQANLDSLELMRIASKASRKELRREAMQRLFELRQDEDIAAFLQRLCLDDKAKSLRSWLKGQLTDKLKQKSELKSILERSLFESGEDLDDDISQYLKLMDNSDIAIEILCQACATNSRAIKQACRKIGYSQPFKRFLINSLAFSTDYLQWRECATALQYINLNQTEKDTAFSMRLRQIEDKYDLSHLARTAAWNNVRLPKLFQLCETGYRDEADAWDADNYLLYCYFYNNEKYRNDVLFYSFHETAAVESVTRTVSASVGFEAYCFVQAKELYYEIKKEDNDFFFDPPAILGLRESYYTNHLSADKRLRLREFAEIAREQARSINADDLIRQ